MIRLRNILVEKNERRDAAMVSGVADIISKVKDADNRRDIAQQMMSKFDLEDVGYDKDSFMKLSKVSDIDEAFSKGQLFAGNLKIDGQKVPVEVELLGANNKTKTFTAKVIHIDKRYYSKLPKDGILNIPARIFRLPGGGWRRIKTPSIFEKKLKEASTLLKQSGYVIPDMYLPTDTDITNEENLDLKNPQGWESFNKHTNRFKKRIHEGRLPEAGYPEEIPFEEFAKKRYDGASKIANDAKEKGGAAMLTYHHFVVKLPYYKKAAEGKFNLSEAKAELNKCVEELKKFQSSIEQIAFQQLVGLIEVLGELLIKYR